MPTLAGAFNYLTRESFRFTMCASGGYVASALAGNACLLYLPTLLNNFGYQTASGAGLGIFGSWATGQATLSLSYYRIEAIVKAVATVVGVKLGGLIADGTLLIFDCTVQCVIAVSQRFFTSPPQEQPSEP